MDNLDAHRPKRIGELIEQQGYELLCLLACSPCYNLVQEAFSKQGLCCGELSAKRQGADRDDGTGT